MARTAIPVLDPPGFLTLPVTAGTADLTLTAADATNFNSAPCTGHEVLLAQGTGTVTVHSAADALGRTGDVTTYTLSAAPKVSVLGPFPVNGWRQTDGTLHVDASAATVLLGVVQLPTIE